MRKPNFFIVGAPKCGTTSLASWLSQHPEVYFSPIKEPFFFDHDWPRRIRSVKDYEALFKNVQSHHIAIGEASTSYLSSDVAIPRILEYSPEARFVVCLRNPVEMAPSLHAQRIWDGLEDIQDFERAWRANHDRRMGKRVPAAGKEQPQRLVYSEQCRLGWQLSRVYDWVSGSHVLPVIMDDMKSDPRATYDRICSFLDISYDNNQQFKRKNSAVRTKSVRLASLARLMENIKYRLGISYSFGIASMIKRKNSVIEKYMVPHYLKRELKDYFQEDIELLEQLLNRDLSAWRADEGYE